MAFDDGRARLALAWAADAPLGADYGMFAHLLDTNGAIIAQHDRPLGYGETVVERLAFLLPEGVTAAQLRLGIVNLATGERLPAFAPDGTPIPDNFALLPVE